MTENKNKYWAFLSYSELDNVERRPGTPDVSCRCWASWLVEALKTFAIPTEFVGQLNGRGEIIPQQIESIFQDAAELSEAGYLSAEVREALEQSSCLIVICSPRSAQSRQVNEVVRYFKQIGRGKNILPIVIAGEPYASTGNQQGMAPDAECFAPALRHPVSPDRTIDTSRLSGKHIFVDARHGVEKREVLAKDHRNAEADLEMAKIQLIALVFGVGFNGLWWREQKRHYLDFAEARQSAQAALGQVEEVRRQLQDAQRQVREAQSKALEIQDLPRDVHGQIQEAQNQAQVAQNQTREAQQQLQEYQNKVRDTQDQLEAASQRALAAENKALEIKRQMTLVQTQLEESRIESRAAQVTQSERVEASRLLPPLPVKSPTERRLTQVFAVLAVLAALTAGLAVYQRRVTSQALAQATAEAAGRYDITEAAMDAGEVRRLLQHIDGVEQASNRWHSLDEMATQIPTAEIPGALLDSALILSDEPRTRFQKWLLIRLGWVNPVSAMTCASAIDGNIVNADGQPDSRLYLQSAVLENWLKTDLPAALNWLTQLSDADSRQQLLEKTIHAVADQPASDSQNKILAACLSELAKTDAVKALTLAKALPAGDCRSAVIVRLWLQADPFAAWEWTTGSDLLLEITQTQPRIPLASADAPRYRALL